ncbi:MAG: glycosyltransferase family 2 protein [Acidimicrobiales bacterium]
MPSAASDQASAPLVSIITPTFNMGGRLDRCIASVRAQTYPEIEHIVIDAGSTDETLDVLGASDVHWISEPDRGQSDAINKGLRLATGDIRGWLNADDTLFPRSIELVVDAVRRTPTAGLVYGDIDQVVLGVSRRVVPSPDFSFADLWQGNRLSQPGTFWTRWAQEVVGEIDEEFHLAMDFELWLRFAKARIPAVYVPEMLARFEVHDDSKTGSQTALAFAEEEARALRKHGEIHGAAMVFDRWYWNEVKGEIADAAAKGRYSEMSAIARRSLPRMRSVYSRTRWFLWLTRFAPRIAARVEKAVVSGSRMR